MLERSRRLLGDPWVQRAILVAVIVWVFWDGLWAGVPRADQVPYLHQVSQFDSLWDILSRSPSWNRTQAPAQDVMLYRPILYLLLGTFYYFFRYDFVAWQSAGLCLHIVVVLGLHLLLTKGGLTRTVFPLLIGLLFGTAFLSSEQVLWNHIVGYLLFCAFGVYATLFLVLYFGSKRLAFLVASLVLGLFAEFTYEVGVLLNLVFAGTLLWRARRGTRVGISGPPRLRRINPWPALGFALSALLFPAASLVDLQARGIALPALEGGPGIWDSARLVAGYSMLQIFRWLMVWLVPTAYSVYAADRAFCTRFLFKFSFLSAINVVSLTWLLIAGFLALRNMPRIQAPKRDSLLSILPALVFLIGYSSIIAGGRALSRGPGFIIHANLYYSYVAYLAVALGIASVSLVGRPSSSTSSVENAPKATDPAPRLALAMIGLVFVNAYSTSALAHGYRYRFAAPRQEAIEQVAAWQARGGAASNRYFLVNPTCRGNETLLWFSEAHFRKGSGWQPPISLADALWPDRSARLNAARIQATGAPVDAIPCDEPNAGH